MALAATAIARTLEHYRWVGYVGLAIILWVAGEMIYNGSQDVFHSVDWLAPSSGGRHWAIPGPPGRGIPQRAFVFRLTCSAPGPFPI